MSLNIFEKSENLGPTILMELRKIIVAPGIFNFFENIHFLKNFEKFKNLKSYISHISINNY